MNRAHAQWALLKSSAFVFTLMGAGLFVSILNARPDGSVVAEIARRVPASLAVEKKAVVKPNFQVMESPCLKAKSKLKAMTTQSHYLRFASSACSQEIRETKLENASNGFEATMFTRGSAFTSDFIPLNDGPNKMKMELTLENGQKLSYDFEITRSIASN